MKPLPICYCTFGRIQRDPHLHSSQGLLSPSHAEYRAEIRRLRRYERAVVAWKTELDPLRRNRVIVRMERLAAASVKRAKEVRRG